MENLETISGELNTLLPDATHGKEEVVIEKSLHERIVEMFKAGKKKKVMARLLGVGIKTVRKILGGQITESIKVGMMLVREVFHF